MKLIVGLGNPGRKYERTPHNIGFVVAEILAARWGGKFNLRRREEAEVLETTVGGEKVILAKPQTFMNLSGYAVRALMTNQPMEIADVLIVLDEAQLELGRLRIRSSGSHGGHNGLRSVIECLGTGEIARLRIGVKPPRPIEDMVDFVLGSMKPEEREVLADMAEIAADAVECWIKEGSDRTATKFNGYRHDAPEPN
jgi:PTH1 family peptidyl-tRNA hydrolase